MDSPENSFPQLIRRLHLKRFEVPPPDVIEGFVPG